jgi:3-methylcrotonyl-CoA carboxylase alpha subunit
MFHTLLIANRGEIACRVIRTARRLGIRTVAVYSEADAGALHVRLADEAHPIGGSAPAGQLPARRRDPRGREGDTGAQAIHPGYGFLSRERRLRRGGRGRRHRLRRAEAASMRQDGQQGRRQGADAGRRRAGGARLQRRRPVPDLLAREAARIGFPLMIKAAHGGGGKGMRVVRALDEFARALESCQREAAGAFGRDRVLLERYIETPRHIEIPGLRRRQGNVIHLGERECSAQRRYQKVLEESPSPAVMTVRSCARRWARPRSRPARDRLRQRRHRRVHRRRRRRRLLLHGDQHPAAGRAPGDRDGDRAGPGRVAAAGRRRRAAAAGAGPGRARGHAIEVRLYAEDPDAASCPAPAG